MAFKIFSNLKQRIYEGKAFHEERLDYERLPVLDADSLITLTRQQGRLRNIRRIVKIDDKRYQVLYQDVIEKFAELVQLMPASQAHHHAVPGGLFIHTLEVLELALTYRQQYKLPLFAPQEIQDKERYVWTYAVFVAVLLHDVGKRLTLCRFELADDNGALFEPFTGKLPLGKHYRIVFLDPKYHLLHEKMGLIFASHLLPPVARNFLLPRLHIMREIMAYIHDEAHDEGIIGKIIREADRASTGRSLAHTDSRKFKGANLENMGERLMTQLRILLAGNHFSVNKSNANVYTTAAGFTYIVSKILADELRNTLAQDGRQDIPHDNNRIFDILQEHGFAENNEKGSVMHYIRRTIEGRSQVFSVLKFKTSRLFAMLPLPFAGEITEVAGKDGKEALQQTDKAYPEAENIAAIGMVNPPAQTAAGDIRHKTATEEPLFSPEKSVSENTDIVADDRVGKTAATENAAMTDTAAEMPPPVEAVQSPAVAARPHTVAESSPDIARNFLQWCHDKIKSKEIVINQSSGIIQKVTYKNRSVIAVVTPRAFLAFGTEQMGLPNHKSTAERIQKAIHAGKLNIPGPKGQIHRYHIKKSENNELGKNRGLNHYLFDIDKFCGENKEIIEIIQRTKNNENLALS